MQSFFKGLLFGAGFTLAFVVITTAWSLWVMPKAMDRMFNQSFVVDDDGKMMPLDEAGDDQRLFRSPGMAMHGQTSPAGSYQGRFDVDAATALEPGPGQIVGRATVRGEPAAGLRFRLALNGDRFSDWATVQGDGSYQVMVPYGEYRIDGYDLDPGQFYRALMGTVLSPATEFVDEVFSVTADVTGTGPELMFVEPVRQLPTSGTLSLDEKAILAWEPHPGAASYRLRFWEGESDEAGSMMGMQECGEELRVQAPFVDLREVDLVFREDRYYALTVYAHDDQDRPVSRSPMGHPRELFRVVGGDPGS